VALFILLILKSVVMFPSLEIVGWHFLYLSALVVFGGLYLLMVAHAIFWFFYSFL
jgi:hypothetical protein